MDKHFVGKFVEIITDLVIITDQGPAPFITQGFYIDKDDTYIHLGDNPIEICRRIKIDNEVHTEISEEPDDPNEGMN